jgi:hypothetical protein
MCQHVEANQLWEKSMDKLQINMKKMGIPLETIEAILEGLQGWRNGQDTQFNIHTTAGMTGCLQTSLSWKHFFKGQTHTIWQKHQALHIIASQLLQNYWTWHGIYGNIVTEYCTISVRVLRCRKLIGKCRSFAQTLRAITLLKHLM